MDTPPFELSATAIKSLNLRDAENIYETINKYKTSADVENIYALKERLSPQIFLRRLTSHPELLMKLMKLCGCVVSGECVVPYFFPNIQLSGNTWQIICNDNSTMRVSENSGETYEEYDADVFMRESKRIGMLWRNRYNGMKRDSVYEHYNANVYIGFSRNYNGDYVKVELVESPYTPLHSIVPMPATVVQCFISSDMACHMYYSEVESGNTTLWVKNIDDTVQLSKLLHNPAFEKRACTSCYKLLRYLSIYSEGTFDIAIHLRHIITAINGTMEEKRYILSQLVQHTLENERYFYYIVIAGYMTVDDVVNKLLTECTCGYDTGISDILYYKSLGLNTRLYSSCHINERNIDDEHSYIHKFMNDPVANTMLRCRWTEKSFGTMMINTVLI